MPAVAGLRFGSEKTDDLHEERGDRAVCEVDRLVGPVATLRVALPGLLAEALDDVPHLESLLRTRCHIPPGGLPSWKRRGPTSADGQFRAERHTPPRRSSTQ